MAHRIGTFFLLLGVLLIALYLFSDMVEAPSCTTFLGGVILLGLGIFLWMRHPAAPPAENQRFRALRSAKKKKPDEKKK